MIGRLVDDGALLRMSWVGFWSGVLATLGGAAQAIAGAIHPAPAAPLYALTPTELSAWITSIASGIGAIVAALNGVAVLVHKIRALPDPPRRRRRPAPPRKRKARPDASPSPPATPADPGAVGPDGPPAAAG